MRKHLGGINPCRTITRSASSLSSIILILMLLNGCGHSSTIFDVETEHFCEDSRYITMTNLHSNNVSLKGWTVETTHATYVLPDIVVAPGEHVNIWSGPGTDDAHNIYIGRSGVVWEPTRGSLRVERPPSLLGNIEMHFLSCTVDLAP